MDQDYDLILAAEVKFFDPIEVPTVADGVIWEVTGPPGPPHLSGDRWIVEIDVRGPDGEKRTLKIDNEASVRRYKRH